MSTETKFDLPEVEEMSSLPPNNNPFQHDQWRMGCNVSGAWIAMFSEFAGLKQKHNLSAEEQKRRDAGEPIYYDDPEEIIMVNSKTGQRFKLKFNSDTTVKE